MALLLTKIPVPEAILTAAELKRVHSSEIESGLFKVSQSCNSLSPYSDSEIEREFIRTQKLNYAPSGKNCSVKINEASTERYFLKKSTALHLSIFTTTDKPVALYEQSFLVSHLLPLALLPFLAFFLSVILEMKFFTPPLVLSCLFFFYSAFNPIDFFKDSFFSLNEIWNQDKNLLGLCLLFLWSRISRPDNTRPFFSKTLFVLLGVLNPAIIVTARRSLMRLGNNIKAKAQLLSLQTLFLMLSFSLLAISRSTEEIFLPRYFTYAFFVFLAFQLFVSPFSIPTYVWKNPFKAMHLICILLGEVGFHFLSPQTPLILRVSLELIAAEILPLKQPRFFIRNGRFLFSRMLVLFFSSFAAFIANKLGVLTLLFTIMQIETFQLGLPFALFIFGTVTGIIFGGIAIPYFFVLSSFAALANIPEAKAGLMDGLVLGTLFSPLSIFNWFTSKEIHLSVHTILNSRLRTLRLSVLAGGIVYFVSGMNSVKVLQPATFLFLLLVMFVNHMRIRKWKWLSEIAVTP